MSKIFKQKIKTQKEPKEIKEKKERKKLNLKLPNLSKIAGAAKEKGVKAKPEIKAGNFIFRLGIRTKLISAFLVPVIFIVILGVRSYSIASDIIIENYETSTDNTINLIANYYDLVLSTIETTAYDIVADDTLVKYFDGKFENNDKYSKYEDPLKKRMVNSKNNNDFLLNITIIPTGKNGSTIYTNKELESASGRVTYEDYAKIQESSVGQYMEKRSFAWMGYHDDIDSILHTSSDLYAMSNMRSIYNSSLRVSALAIFDIDYKTFKSVLTETELCEDSIVGIITPDGREISTKILPEGATESEDQIDNYLLNMDFVQGFMESEETEGKGYEKINGEKYYTVYKKLDMNGFTIVAMIPESEIVGDTVTISNSTVSLVVLSVIVAVLLGTFISWSFARAIKKMVKGLAQVADGDLTVKITTRRKDEFLALAKGINNMVVKVRELLNRANSVTGIVEESSDEVSGSADIMLQSAQEIKKSITEINLGIDGTAEESAVCLQQMDTLSEQITAVTKSAENISNTSAKTRDFVSSGLVVIDELKAKANDTKEVTKNVIDKIEELNTSSASIEQIISVINSIASQTSLLSLNASIEAARAGDAGRGFSVVAEEIRKLAEQSMESVKNIQKIVDTIRKQTQETVDVARKSSDIVNSQDETLKETIDTFTSIDEHVASLTGDLDSILEEIQEINKAKTETLAAVESISAISQETTAVSNQVSESVDKQLKAAENLATAANGLKDDANDLSDAIHVFKV